jgi:hypothetical protein
MTDKKPALYLRCSSGFGNKVFELISAIYLKKKYSTFDLFFAVDKSFHDKPDDPFIGYIFPGSRSVVKYIYMSVFYKLKDTLPIDAIWIENLSDLPDTIDHNIRFAGLYKFAFQMWNTFDTTDKAVFNINQNLLSPQIKDLATREFACVHIRYGDKLCYAYEKNNNDKYTHYQLPVYTPQFYIDQINYYLDKNVYTIVMTDSVDLVKKYIMTNFKDNPHVNLLDTRFIDSFYLLTKAKYITLSHSTFSFAAAYINSDAVCHIVKKYVIDSVKDYILEDDAYDPKWIVIDNKNYALNFDQNLIEQMISNTDECKKIIRKK